MSIRVLYEFPSFDTGAFSSASFSMDGGDARLSVLIEGLDEIVLSFTRARWHQYTANYNCSDEQIRSAYFKLVELEASEVARHYVAADKASQKAYTGLRHFRVFLDGHGCHELFAQEVVVEQHTRHLSAGA
jgi:hypothetical protein